ncbi:MAG: single-stranded DNA-binding protein [Bdellovibrionota bacterium]
MASINKVMIMGRLGQDPELRYTQNQVPVCTMNIATTEFRNGPDGQRQEMTEWHRVIVWQKTAENCAKYLAKGRGVYVEGRLQTRSWDDKNGQKRYTTEIVGTNVQFLPGARDNASSGYSGFEGRSSSGMGAQDTGGDFPQADADFTSRFGGPDTASLDEIPF